MPPSVALLLWIVLVVALLRFDPGTRARPSLALWVPLTIFFISVSRLPSQWLTGTGFASQSLEEGNPLDRSIHLGLILLALGILIARSFSWKELVARNKVIVVFLLYALVSVSWSDFPFVALKRWVRDLGGYVAVLVVLSETQSVEAFRILLRRLFFLSIPLSIVLVKYFPELGRSYNEWTGTAFYSGVATSKNMLGLLCLGSGLYFSWDLLRRWHTRGSTRERLAILVNVAFIGQTLWLLNLADSATARVCLALGTAVLVLGHTRGVISRPYILKAGIPAVVLLSIIATHFLGDLVRSLTQAVGRDPTLTERTEIWETLLSVGINPLLGTGYESFWLGSRLEWVWEAYGLINQAHNGYLQVYLNLGLIGLTLLLGVLISNYATNCRRLSLASGFGTLGLALWTVLLYYNVTEAAMGGGLLWTMLLATSLEAGGRPVPAPDTLLRLRQGGIVELGLGWNARRPVLQDSVRPTSPGARALVLGALPCGPMSQLRGAMRPAHAYRTVDAKRRMSPATVTLEGKRRFL